MRMMCMRGGWVALLVASLAGRAFAGVMVPTFTDETATRLSADAGVGSNDPSEKDYGIGDFDRDGDDDVIVARRTGFNGNSGSPLPNTLFMNVDGVMTDMTGALAPGLLTSNRSRDVVVADFNNDGWLDAMVVNGPSTAPVLLMNQGDTSGVWQGFVEDGSALPAGFNVDAWTVAAGDLLNDDDPYPDVFVGVRIGTDRLLVNNGESGGVWQGFSDGSTRLGANANTSAVRSSAIADMNDDGDEDIVEDVTNPTGATRILSNDGSGLFTGSPQTVISGAAYNFALGHLDGNGSLDVFSVKNGLDQYRENLGPGAGELITFGPTFNAPNSNGFGAICRVDDLNHDGTDDFLVADLDQEFPQDCSRRLKIFLNTGSSPYLIDGYPVPQAWNMNGTSDVAMIDIDGDFDLDMLIGACAGNRVFTQDGTPGDSDGDGDLDLVDFEAFQDCFGSTDPDCLADFDFDADGDLDFADFAAFQLAFTGSL